MLQDLRFGFRLLTKSPGFAFAAIAVLALGIGLNTAVFSLTYTLAFSPRPFPDSGNVVQLYTRDRQEPTNYRAFSYPLYRDLAQRTELFSGVLAHTATVVGVGERGETRRAFAALVSANYFSTLGVPLLRGRAFTPAEEKPGAAAEVVIASHQFWKKTGFDEKLVGSTIRINERVFTIVGVTPEGFSGTMMLLGPEFYFPLGVYSQLSSELIAGERSGLEKSDSYGLITVARLAPGVTRESASAALAGVGLGLEQNFPVEFKDKTVTLGSLPRLGTSTSPREDTAAAVAGSLLIALAIAMLLVVCLNLAGLLLARGEARRKEFAVRLALGGGRARLVRQLLVESLLLAGAGGTLGFALATTAHEWLQAAINLRLPFTLYLSSNAAPAIIVASVAFCLLATLFFALGPALKLSRADVLTDLKGQPGESSVAKRRRWLPRHPLVVAQIALSLSLLVAASLFVRMALRLSITETGFSADHTIVAEVDAGLAGMDNAQGLAVFNQVRDRLAALPGAQAAATAAIVPFGMVNMHESVQRAGAKSEPGRRPATAAEGLGFNARWNSVTSDYFAALGIPLLRGRTFTAAESQSVGGPAVAIIDEVLARKLFPEGDALGQRIQWEDDERMRAGERRDMEIVGIVRATRMDYGQREAGRTIFVPFGQGVRSNVHFHLRTAANDAASAAAMVDVVRRTLQEAAPGLPVLSVQTFGQHMESNLESWMARLASTIFSFFGLVAMIVAVVGIYGVKAYSVSRRTREIGVRMALGARPGDVQTMILREGAAIAGLGIALGLLLSLGLGQAMAAVFYDLAAFDPLVFGGAATAFALASLAACWVPARRATRVNPLEALRAE